MKSLYHWVLSWAESSHGTRFMAFISFAESSFFPIPADPLLIALALGKIRKALYFAMVCTVASVLGGVFGYIIGYFLWWSSPNEFSSLANSSISRVNFEKADLQCSSLQSSIVKESNFKKADLRWANLKDSFFQNSDFTEADLRNSNLSNAKILECCLQGALFNYHTNLPFSADDALAKGMILCEEI